jgi:hypothetical protein
MYILNKYEHFCRLRQFLLYSCCLLPALRIWGAGFFIIGGDGIMWKWDVGEKVIVCEANMARDRNMFRAPREGRTATEMIHSGERADVVTWQWPGDNRVFLIPSEIFQTMAYGGLIRDVLSFVGQCYRDQHYPSDLIVQSSLRRIADGICLSWNSRVAETIDKCLSFARFYTIRNQDVILMLNKNGTVKNKVSRTFGYVDMVDRVKIWEGKEIPKNKTWYNITLSQMYAAALKELPAAPLPVAVLDAAHAAPWRITPMVKNLAYHLAARVPQREVRLLLPTIRQIAGLVERKDGRTDKTRHSIESALGYLHPVMVSNFQFEKDGYTISMAGHLVGRNKDA